MGNYFNAKNKIIESLKARVGGQAASVNNGKSSYPYPRALVFLAIFGLPIIFAHSAYATSASISVDKNTVELNLVPSMASSGSGVSNHTVNVKTDCSSGYNVYASATSSGDNKLHLDGNSSNTGATNSISASSNTMASPSPLSANTWGVGTTSSAFSGVPAYYELNTSDQGSNPTALYSSDNTGSGAGLATGEDKTIYYSANVNTSLEPGSYSGTVLYTVLMKSACYNYTLSFNSDGGSGTIASASMDYGATVDLSTYQNKFTKVGYTQSGWKDQSGNTYGLTDVVDVNPNNLSTVTLTAVWTPYTYTVTYSAGSGSGTPSKTSETVTYGSTVTMPTVSGMTTPDSYHTFAGWNKLSGASGGTYASGASVSVAELVATGTNSSGTATTVPNSGSTIALYAAWDGTQTFAQAGLTSGSSTMQDMTSSICSRIKTHDTISLVDNREGAGGKRTYKVRKLADGNCWMVQNLALYDITLSSSDSMSNISTDSSHASYNFQIPSSTTADFTSSAKAATPYVYYSSKPSTSVTEETAYYNYYAATAGFSYYQDGKSSGTTDYDICPANWRLPKGKNNTDKSFRNLAMAYGGNGSNGTNHTVHNRLIATDGPAFVYSGLFNGGSLYNVGTSGFWWSSTVGNTIIGGYNLLLNSGDSVYPQNGSSEYYGFAVRCVAKNNYTISYNSNGGTGTMDDQILSSGQSVPLSSNTFTRSGHTFLGWSANSSATTATYTDGQSVTDLAAANGSLTLYAVWEKTYGSDTFQGFNCSTDLASGSTTTLKDVRDNQTYGVYRIPTNSAASDVAGKCIMTDNLKLGMVTAGDITGSSNLSLTEEKSNFDSNAYNASYDKVTYASTETVKYIASTSASSWSSTDSYTNKQYTYGSGNYAFGYYSWGAALVVCPSGWRLPISSEYNNSTSYNSSTTGISKAANNSRTTLMASPWNFKYTGSFSSSGFSGQSTAGTYWSATQSSTGGSYGLVFNSIYGVILNGISKYNGRAARCIAD